MKLVHNEETSQLEMSRAERVLAIAMVIFLLIGGAWVFREIQNIPARPDYSAIEARYVSPELRKDYGLAQDAYWAGSNNLQKAQQEFAKASWEHEFRREEYRVMLDKGANDPEHEQAYYDALRDYVVAQNNLEVAQAVEKRTQDTLNIKQAELNTAYEKVSSDLEVERRAFEWKLLILRIVYAIPVFALALLAFTRMRRNGSQYLIFGTALIGFASLQLVYLFGLYSWHLLRDVAQIAISLMGTALCIGGIVAIRRYLIEPTRVTKVRTRRGLCPSCGTPAGSNTYCVSCGEQLQKKCGSCGNNRPVRGEYCPHCGSK